MLLTDEMKGLVRCWDWLIFVGIRRDSDQSNDGVERAGPRSEWSLHLCDW